MHIETTGDLKNSGIRTSRPRIISKEFERRVVAEMSVSTADADPGRECGLGNQVQTYTRCNKNVFVILGNLIDAEVDLLLEVDQHWYFHSQRKQFKTFQSVSVAEIKADALAGVQKRIEGGYAYNAMIAYKGPADNSRELAALLSVRKSNKCPAAKDDSQEELPSYH